MKKIFHMVSTLNGGPGNVVKDITEILEKNGFDNYILSPRGQCDFKKHHLVAKKSFVLSRLFSKFFEKISPEPLIGKTFWPEVLLFNRINQIKSIGVNPDIVILYWYKNFIDNKTIINLYKKFKCKIFIYLMDFAPLTGGCHYPYDCTNFKTGCSNCRATFKLLSKKISINSKCSKKTFEKCGIEIICPTTESLKFSDNSFITKNLIKHLLLIPLKTEGTLNIKKNDLSFDKKKYILIGSQDLDDIRKGSVYKFKILKYLHDHMNENERKNTIVITVGNGKIADIPFKTIENSYIDIEELYALYKRSDIFISTSIADMGPMMINQSIASGTPVASFNIGIVEDLIKDNWNGFISDVGDWETLAQKILFFLNTTVEEKEKFSKNCLQITKEKLSEDNFSINILKILRGDQNV